MKQGKSIQWAVLFASFTLLAVFGGGCGGGGGSSGGGGSTATIRGVSTLAFVDVDGPKVQALVVEYSDELTSGSVDTSTYEVFTYANLPEVSESTGAETLHTYVDVVASSGTPGAVTKVYVSQTPEIGAGSSSGKYVIIEVNTASQLSGVSSNWRPKLAGGVKQVKAISAGSVSVPASATVVGNYAPSTVVGRDGNSIVQTVTDDNSYVIKGLEGYKIYTSGGAGSTIASSNKSGITVAGGSFETEEDSCFSEATGQKTTAHLMYNLFVPADYDAGKKYGLVLHINDAGVLGGDPMIALTETNVAVNYATLGQDIVKKNGLDGLIVVIPQIPEGHPTVGDNWTGTEDVQATWQLLDHLTSTYTIDPDRIYGSGQSMGGMQVLYMAAQRDNYFAGIWSIGSQWANNYSKAELPFISRGQCTVYAKYPIANVYNTNVKYITNVDWENWYYSVSDDNILITNMSGDGFATTLWDIFKHYYEVKASQILPYQQWNSLTESREDQNMKLRALTKQSNGGAGIYWNALAGGDHMATWIYAHAITASYEWLLTQTAASEGARAKSSSALKALNETYSSEGYYYGDSSGGTKCLDTGTASGGPQMSGKAGLDYQPQKAYGSSCGGSVPSKDGQSLLTSCP
ncbi:MAG: prolyl oligopeptidase family serine peptidase [Candidatus Accumulibacter sp.]|jgi:predicted peptidase|nr:prolyl oligopeptidase family serine peptidase [Accumulibacter sp.]